MNRIKTINSLWIILIAVFIWLLLMTFILLEISSSKMDKPVNPPVEQIEEATYDWPIYESRQKDRVGREKAQ